MNETVDEEELLSIQPITKKQPVLRSTSKIDIYDLDRLIPLVLVNNCVGITS